MMNDSNLHTYISLFSSAGVGCYGFKLEGFECIATNELIARRLDIQKFNKKCKYDSGYICGDITDPEIKGKLYSEVEFWARKEKISKIDVVVATPPCQGMSVANHKKTENDVVRNSLVIESIKIIEKLNPNFFIFENVPAFMKTLCTDTDGKLKPISEAISKHLGGNYSYVSRIMNFKNYGSFSSRQRTIVIGVIKDLADEISPFELFPDYCEEKTLREVIGDLKPLKEFGEIDETDIYHSFRLYPQHMRSWISEIKEGETAFDNKDDNKKPHQIIGGKLIINKNKNSDKYKRQYWDKVGPCIHTRNDQLASQNTVHPSDDRVFSIRELMRLMSIPQDFKWVNIDFDVLNKMPKEEKRKFLKTEEIKIRQSIGEAVPTVIFESIARKIKNCLNYKILKKTEILRIINDYNLINVNNLKKFIQDNPFNLSITTLSRIAEISNTSRFDNAAYFTNKALITEMLKDLPESDKECISILEPSVGVGNFIPLLVARFPNKKIEFDLVDIDQNSLNITKLLLNKVLNNKAQVKINLINDDFLLHNFNKTYDYVIGNPPFYKMGSNSKLLPIYKKDVINDKTNNICSFFLEKAIDIGNYISFVFPKFLLNTPEFSITRKLLSKKSVPSIIDFGEKGFPGVLIETIAISINNLKRPSKTRVFSYTENIEKTQKQVYIFDQKLPYWIIYRDSFFDSVCDKLSLGIFNVFRDRQITNSMLKENGDLRVLKSRNISDDGSKIINIKGYDAYINLKEARNLTIYSYLNNDRVYITPNMTYKPRMMKKPKGCITNGSIAILIPKNDIMLTDKQLKYFSTEEYRKFYSIARNYQTRSLNIDANSVYFFGILKDNK